MDRKKIHELLDLILEIQERGEGKDGYPYVNIEFSNYGSRIFLSAQENGFVANGDYHLFSFLLPELPGGNESGLLKVFVTYYTAAMNGLQFIAKV